MKKIFSILCLAFVVLTSVAAQATEKKAEAYVQGVSNRVLDIISNTKLSQDEKQQKLITVFEQTVDTKWIGRFVLGRYYRTATAAQKKSYDDVYREFLIRSYVPRFKEYKGQKFELTETRIEGKDEYLVKTLIKSENEAAIRVDYRVRDTGNGFKVSDIISEGVSLINTQRSEFGSVVSREGMDYLIEKLEERLAKLKSED